MNALRSTAFTICFIASLLGCVAPGSSIGHVSIRGSLESMSGRRLAHRELQFILPAAYGLGGLDLVLDKPEDFGHQDRTFSVTTNSAGEFSQDLGDHIYHVSCWLLPPLGCFPKAPPSPFLLLRMPTLPGEYYAVQTHDGEFKVFTGAGLEIPFSESNLSKLTASSESGADDGKRWTVGIIDLRLASP